MKEIVELMDLSYLPSFNDKYKLTFTPLDKVNSESLTQINFLCNIIFANKEKYIPFLKRLIILDIDFIDDCRAVISIKDCRNKELLPKQNKGLSFNSKTEVFDYINKKYIKNQRFELIHKYDSFNKYVFVDRYIDENLVECGFTRLTQEDLEYHQCPFD